MPPRDPNVVQLDFPQLTSDLINELSLVGTIGLLNFLPEVRPTFIIGSRGLTAVVNDITYEPAEIFDGTILTPVGANEIVADTGALAAGDFDVKIWASLAVDAASGNTETILIQHRNAANNANLSEWRSEANIGGQSDISIDIALLIALNERLRIVNRITFTGRISGTIAAKRRVVP